MRLNKRIKSIVITYEDEECSRLTGEQAIRFQEIIEQYIMAYRMVSVNNTSQVLSKYNITPDSLQELEYETIRNGFSINGVV